jgi:hypothetical protein
LVTDHIESRLWLIKKFFGATSSIKDRILRIGGIGLQPS